MDYTNGTDYAGEPCRKASDHDIKESAKEHYQQMSYRLGHFNNVIPKAIDFYFENKDNAYLNTRQFEVVNEFIDSLHTGISKLLAVEFLDYEDKNWLFGDPKLVSEKKQRELEQCQRLVRELKEIINAN